MKSVVVIRVFLLLMVCFTSAMAQTSSDPGRVSASDVTAGAVAAPTGGRIEVKKAKQGFLTPSVATVPGAQPETSRRVGSIMKSVFDKGAEAQSVSTTDVPGTYNTTRVNSTHCPSVSANNVSCEAIDGLLAAHENQRMDSADTQLNPALQQVFKPAVPVHGVYGKCGLDGRPLGAGAGDGSCWTPNTR